MNVMIAVDYKYISHARVMLASLRDSMPYEEINVFLIHSSLEKDILDDLKIYLFNKYKINLKDIKVTNTPFDQCKYGMHFSVEISYRLLATEVLPDNIDRILWLDSDIVVRKSIAEFYYSEMGQQFVCACPGRGELKKHNERLGLEKGHVYFNSGVLLMNLRRMREVKILDKYIEIVKTYGDKLLFLDQDILNIAFSDGEVKYFDALQYNCQIGSDFRVAKRDKKQFVERCAVMHFAATSKPWNIMYRNGIQRYYWRYALKDGRIIEYLMYCIIAPLRTLYLKYGNFRGK